MVLDEGNLVVVSESQVVFMGYSTTEQLDASGEWEGKVKSARRLYPAAALRRGIAGSVEAVARAGKGVFLRRCNSYPFCTVAGATATARAGHGRFIPCSTFAA
jgi:hypothetical protein